MKGKKLLVILSLLFLFLFSTTFSQPLFDIYPNGANSCGTVNFTNFSSPPDNYIGATCKPPRSDIGGAPQGLDYFPILVLFVQFANEPDITGYGWHTGQQGPDWIDSVVSFNRGNDNSDWWNTYNEYQMSDYWHEFSRGRLHIRGQAIPITLPKTEADYLQPGGGGSARVYKDIYDYLISLGSQIYWPMYDKWTNQGGTGQYVWQSDSRVDMIYIVFRHDPSSLISGAEGFCPQPPAEGEDPNTGNYLVYNQGGVQVNIASWNASANASGIVVNGRGGITSRDLYLEVGVHEHGHYLFEDHDLYGKMAYGNGREFSLSPWESIKLGYITPKILNYDEPEIILGDITSRNGHAGDEGEVIQVPISDNGSENEFFLIANRRKVSEWDRRIAGDTNPDPKIFLKDINPEYGKGLYIYHCSNGYNMVHGNYWDLECADGLWNWEYYGMSFPIWGPNIQKCGYRRATVSRLNDNSSFASSLNNRDGISFGYINQVMCGDNGGLWFSIGKSHTVNPLSYGTDRIYANEEELWYSLEGAGDRWDAWNIGYNEIFSPYSNPNTKNWADGQTDIFIWYKALNPATNEATLEIYKTGSGGYVNEMQILEETPPSRPVEIKVDYWNYWGDVWHPRITWLQNQEPDMVSDLNGKKKYRIYRATKSYMNQIPGPPQLIADNVEFYPNETPTYIDYQVLGYLSSISGDAPWLYPVRYWVKAVDKYADSSVYSDFAGAIGINDGSYINPGGNDNSSINGNIPKKFDLYQNYPNPFNPVTNIQYDLPKDVFVSIKIYDLLGREIKTLVNEYKNAGSYIVNFNGSELASGIYFYRINAGSFNQVKRMVLIK